MYVLFYKYRLSYLNILLNAYPINNPPKIEIKTNKFGPIYAENITKNNPNIKNIAIPFILKNAESPAMNNKAIAANISGFPANTEIISVSKDNGSIQVILIPPKQFHYISF